MFECSRGFGGNVLFVDSIFEFRFRHFFTKFHFDSMRKNIPHHPRVGLTLIVIVTDKLNSHISPGNYLRLIGIFKEICLLILTFFITQKLTLV